jgi:hypothetical protein
VSTDETRDARSQAISRAIAKAEEAHGRFLTDAERLRVSYEAVNRLDFENARSLLVYCSRARQRIAGDARPEVVAHREVVAHFTDFGGITLTSRFGDTVARSARGARWEIRGGDGRRVDRGVYGPQPGDIEKYKLRCPTCRLDLSARGRILDEIIRSALDRGERQMDLEELKAFYNATLRREPGGARMRPKS